MKRFEVILFDLGDTLIYFNGDWPEVMSRADQAMLQSLQASGLPLGQEFLEVYRRRMEAYFRERDTEFIEYTAYRVLHNLLVEWGFSNTDERILRQALVNLFTVTQAHWLPEVDAKPTLQTLRMLGYRLGLISNASDDTDVQSLVDKAGLRLYFEVIVTSAALGIRKPNPKIFQTALDQLGASPFRTAMVGDTLGADVLGARNAGLYSIWITRRADNAANRAHADTIQPDLRITSLSELPEVLESFEC
jgi:putative hydrolase of the HAD superfamily